MTRGMAQVLLAGFLIPLGFIVFVVAFMTVEDMYSMTSRQGFAIAGIVTWAMAVVYWLLLWRKSVRWTSGRIRHTVFCTLLTPAFVIALLMFLWTWSERARQPWNNEWGQNELYLSGAILTPILWLIGTILIWRPTNAEHAGTLKGSTGATVCCPNCGYNLSGLTEARCPECGEKYTLDQLMASQHEAGGQSVSLTRADGRSIVTEVNRG
jgi:hypothetical protein